MNEFINIILLICKSQKYFMLVYIMRISRQLVGLYKYIHIQIHNMAWGCVFLKGCSFLYSLRENGGKFLACRLYGTYKARKILIYFIINTYIIYFPTYDNVKTSIPSLSVTISKSTNIYTCMWKWKLVYFAIMML